jgi:hypothetical protein
LLPYPNQVRKNAYLACKGLNVLAFKHTIYGKLITAFILGKTKNLEIRYLFRSHEKKNMDGGGIAAQTSLTFLQRENYFQNRKLISTIV